VRRFSSSHEAPHRNAVWQADHKQLPVVDGSDHRRVLPAAALVGVPFFIWLLRRRDRSSEAVFT
jgi:hypothetical protein